VNVVDFKLNANIAVNAPKFHHQWLPETITWKITRKVPLAELKRKITFEKVKYIGKTE
jgi:gamma-glutamyltranspeptidase/glutathione hydrolase